MMPSDGKCWVPNCEATPDKNPNYLFFPLPADPAYKETWLALTRRKFTSYDNIYFCEHHFRKSAFEIVFGKTIGLNPRTMPVYKMPQLICRTCLTTIPKASFFCVVSTTIPSPVPKELQTDVLPCRPEPLYHVLTFCMPNLNLPQNPPALVCIKCYHTIWEYFVFKMKSNTIESRVREGLTAEEYGKVVLCRCCPDTSSSFFVLNESHQMGQVLKNIFINNFSKTIVPLKVCLKCWNVIYKLTEFHQNCISVDKQLLRCSELNEAQMYQNLQSTSMTPILQEHLTMKYPSDQNQLALLPTENGAQPQLFGPSDQKQKAIHGMPQVQYFVQNHASMSSSSENSNSNSVPGYSEQTFSEVKRSATVSEVPSDKQVSHLETIVLDSDDDSPKLLPEAQVKTKPESKAAREREKNFMLNLQNVLAELVLKHSYGVRPDLDSHEMARMNLEMWTKVMHELLNLGYSVTLENVQLLWNTMKVRTKSMQKSVGPKPYLEHLVDIYLSRTERTKDLADRVSKWMNLDEKSSASSPDSVKFQMKKKLVERVEVKPTERSVSAFEGRNFICLDNDSDTKKASRPPATNAASSKRAFKTEPDKKIKRDCDSKCQNTSNIASGTKTRRSVPQKKLPRQPKTAPPKPINEKAPGEPIKSNRGRKKKTKNLRGRGVRETWNHQQKLELIREIRKEYNYLISKGELGNRGHNKGQWSPWKKILERLTSRGYKNCSFSKLYYLWSKMKMSATIHEKNGKDIVDDEVWELIQLHQDVHCQLPLQPNMDRKTRGQNEVDQAASNSKSTPRSKSPPLKKLRTAMSNQSPTINYEHLSREVIKNPKLKDYTMNDTHTGWDMIQNAAVEDTHKEEYTIYTHTGQNVVEEADTVVKSTPQDGIQISAINFEHTGREIIEKNTDNHQVVGNEVLKLLKTYRYCNEDQIKGNCTKPLEEGPPPPHPVESDSSSFRNEDQRKLDLISIIRSFGNEVFKNPECSTGMEFWTRVQYKLSEKGHDMTQNHTRATWNNMLYSAKLTWAQEGRKPNVGDQEIIDFMTNVIKDKENSKVDSKLNLRVKEEDSGFEDSERKGSPLAGNTDRRSDACGKRDAAGAYDYVSLEDLKKTYRKVSEKPKPVVLDEVIELSDSD